MTDIIAPDCSILIKSYVSITTRVASLVSIPGVARLENQQPPGSSADVSRHLDSPSETS